MTIFRRFIVLTIAIILSGCENDTRNIPLNPTADLSFSGNFRTLNSENVSGKVTLHLSDGTYSSSTDLSFGYAAGKFEITESTITFTDTLDTPMLMQYGPSYVLTGEHLYTFDGGNLMLWKKKNVGEILYTLELTQ